MPSPKISLPSTMAGVLTVGNLMAGVLLVHRVRSAALGSVDRQANVGTLAKLAMPETNSLSPAGSGDAM